MRKNYLLLLTLITLLLAGGIFSPFAQGENVKVLVRQIGISTYSYKVINLTNNPITSLQIGFNRHRKNSEEELTMVPTTVESPQGWKGETVFLEESNLLHIDWVISDLTTYSYAIQPGGSLDGFIVRMPDSYDLMKQTYFTVIYGSGARVWDSANVQVDNDPVPPVITITTPANGGVYLLNQTVLAEWLVTDEGSGIATSSGTVPSSSVIDTSTVGSHSFTVSATDNADNSASQTVEYSVVYSSPNPDFFLPPVKNNQVFKQGSTIPVKFQVTDANGAYVSTATASIVLQQYSVDEPIGNFAF